MLLVAQSQMQNIHLCLLKLKQSREAAISSVTTIHTPSIF